jgi:SAM-dependent methyltransferase
MNVTKTNERLLKWFKGIWVTPAAKRHALVGPAHLWKMKRDFQFRFLKRAGLGPEHYLLDLGCGTLRGGIPLIRYLQERHYFGIEVRSGVLEEGKRELEEAKLASKQPLLLLTENVALLHLEQRFDFIWAYSVLIHLSDSILGDVLCFVREHLTATGAFYANVNIGEHEDGSWRGFPIVWRTVPFYEEMASSNGLSVVDMGTIASLGFKSGHKNHDEKRMLRFHRR